MSEITPLPGVLGDEPVPRPPPLPPPDLPTGAAIGNPPTPQQLLNQALAAVRGGDLETARELLDLDAPPATLGQVFRLYQAEIDNQARQLIDSQSRTELALEWSTRLFRMLPVSALLVDDLGRIVDANEQAQADFALRSALRLLPVPLRRLMADTHTELRVAALLGEARSGASAAADDVAMRTLDGTARWVDLRITLIPARAGAGARPLRLCVLNDRTARVEAQRARDAANAAEHARDLAQSASRAKSQLLSRVSHELRTPLNAVLGFSHLLLGTNSTLDAEARRRVQHIAQAGQQLLHLVDEVLEINRAEAGQLQLQLQPVSITEVVHEVLELQEPMAAVQTLQLSFAPLGPLPTVLADRRRLCQLLTNLVGNAVKYNRPRGWVRVEATLDPGQGFGQEPAVALTVADSGIGIAPEALSHLFEPFNRLGAERSATPGVGLGLCITRTLAEAMHGSLTVDSVLGEGSRFTVRLPIAH